MLNKQLSQLLQGALACQDAKGLKFAYALQKNIRLMKQEIKHIFELIQPSEDYKLYDKEREELAKKYAEKDEKGEPVVENEQYKIKGKKKFDKELKELQEKYGKVYKDQEEKEVIFQARLEQECTIPFHKIEEKNLPSDLSARQLDIISDFMYSRPVEKD